MSTVSSTNESIEKIGLFKRLYNWVLHWSQTTYALPALFILSFAESSFFPIPPDILLITMTLAVTNRWFKFATICTVASVLGGIVGYFIGMFAWESVGLWIMESILHIEMVTVNGKPDIALPTYIISTMGDYIGAEHLFAAYEKWNAWIVFIFGLTPLPYKLITISAGVAAVNLPTFIVASIFARAARFYVVAWIISRWGEQAKVFIDKYFGILTFAFVVLLIGGLALIKLAF